MCQHSSCPGSGGSVLLLLALAVAFLAVCGAQPFTETRTDNPPPPPPRPRNPLDVREKPPPVPNPPTGRYGEVIYKNNPIPWHTPEDTILTDTEHMPVVPGLLLADIQPQCQAMRSQETQRAPRLADSPVQQIEPLVFLEDEHNSNMADNDQGVSEDGGVAADDRDFEGGESWNQRKSIVSKADIAVEELHERFHLNMYNLSHPNVMVRTTKPHPPPPTRCFDSDVYTNADAFTLAWRRMFPVSSLKFECHVPVTCAICKVASMLSPYAPQLFLEECNRLALFAKWVGSLQQITDCTVVDKLVAQRGYGLPLSPVLYPAPMDPAWQRIMGSKSCQYTKNLIVIDKDPMNDYAIFCRKLSTVMINHPDMAEFARFPHRFCAEARCCENIF
eukprot:gnl/Hemi2/15987_TR5288_c0_g1_i1.p1 gnl/Hemi2/15987_TR5288_c0_g1~~gnl/Hemi2/15987_TR5288_c0_g1_i1.p1  ORF type:complete len:389 (-),score=8.41 gnl/Hemi2/15987_TR5288_c0_g1_i1:50-1216(-)